MWQSEGTHSSIFSSSARRWQDPEGKAQHAQSDHCTCRPWGSRFLERVLYPPPPQIWTGIKALDLKDTLFQGSRRLI